MRAKIIATGEIKEIHRISNNGNVVYFLNGENLIASYKIDEVELIKEDNIDWEQRRFELVREMLPISAKSATTLYETHELDDGITVAEKAVSIALSYADAVIEKLKEA